MAKDPYKYFRVEARELLDLISRAILDLEKTPSADLVARVQRLVHTLKGASRVVKLRDMADCAHAFEDALALLPDADGPVSPQLIDTLLALTDQMNALLAELNAHGRSISDAANVGKALSSVHTIVSTHARELDPLLTGISEAHSQLEKLRQGLHGVELAASTSIDQLDRELRQVREAAERIRLIPAGTLFVPLERTARDIAQAFGKELKFDSSGGNIRLDGQILGAIQGALLHIVRNAVVHGIETPEERRARGKTQTGHITLSVARRGRQVTFTCSDDGRGIDFDAVRRIAGQKGLLPPGAQASDTEALLAVLLKGGLSTAGTVTEESGRGVGLDVVRDALEQLGGTVMAHTESHRGTTFDLTVPLTLAALDTLIVEAAGVTVLIPLEAVRRTLRLASDDILQSPQGESIVYEGRSIPFLRLARVMGLPVDSAKNSQKLCSAVVIETDNGIAAAGLDRLLGTVNAVVSAVPALAPAVSIVAGIAMDAEGDPQLVLDPARLISEAQSAGLSVAALVATQASILIIDDSLTTRMLERSILESAGYDVEVAISGEDGLDKVRQGTYSLILVDVEMPGMNGFTFVEKIRLDPNLRGIPCIMVSSRSAPEDIQRGREVGADAYIAKSEFDQVELLEHIRKLLAEVA